MKSNANGLMGDLESIKALLEEDDDLASLGTASDPVQEVSFDSFTAADLATDLAGDDIADDLAEEFAEELVDDSDWADERLEDELLTTAAAPNAAPFPHAPAATAATAASLDALLGTDFHDATATVMARARGLIEQHPNEWSPQQTDELSDALRVRIDGAVQEWISASLAAHAGELQQRLLNAVRDELARHLEAFEIADDSDQP